jgi:hypothetical protein
MSRRKPTVKTTTEIVRTEDSIVRTTVTTEVTPNVVDFQDILDATEIVGDDDMGPPWKEHDGWDHETVSDSAYEERGADVCAMRAWCCSENTVVELSKDDDARILRFHRERGCSKQVAREILAIDRRQRLAQIVERRSVGYPWYGVTCDFQGYGSSCWGIDDYDYAYRDVRCEVADEVAYEMEQDGYTVANKPVFVHMKGRNQTKEEYRAMLKRNLRLDCWTD